MSNTRTDHSEWNEHCERRELARLLPPPPHPEPSPSQLALRRDFLLAEFARPRPFAALTARWRGLVAVTVIATAAALTAVALTPGSSSSHASPAESAASAELLNRIAQAAHNRPQPPAQDSQFTYLWTVTHFKALTETPEGTMTRTDTTEVVERWTAVDGNREGLLRRDGADEPLPSVTHSALDSPTYRLLATLPTDPDALLKLIYADAVANHGPGSGSTTGPDHEAFIAIGDILRSSVVPPQTGSALYRAAARIPGVVTVNDSVDATGRHGVAVARVNDGRRFEWIFDPTTLALLGTRTVALSDGPWGRSGDEVGSTAVLAQGIVGAPGEPIPPEPAKSSQSANSASH
ncbi:CU044_5270 family protein [Kitasatospora sp. NPDC008115]|uniref:CU044_5270 family protein n=1 Tax=Kitasatospora sp. NPDC008115 TaxID=3364022 RepID=UPI0036E27DFF